MVATLEASRVNPSSFLSALLALKTPPARNDEDANGLRAELVKSNTAGDPIAWLCRWLGEPTNPSGFILHNPAWARDRHVWRPVFLKVADEVFEFPLIHPAVYGDDNPQFRIRTAPGKDALSP